MMNLAVLTTLVCLISIQLALCAGQALFLLTPASPLASALLPEWAAALQPKWDMVIFGIFIVSAGAGQMLALGLGRRKLQEAAWWRGVLLYLGIEAVLTFLLLSAAFQLMIYDNRPVLARRAFLILLVLALALKLFWPEIRRGIERAGVYAGRFSESAALRWAANAVCPLLIVSLVFVPDLERVLAEMFIGEQFHHLDFFLMSPGWAALNGHWPYVGVISQYGLGVPVVLSKLTGMFGGFDYLPALKMIMTIVIVYYLLLYGLARWWFNSGLLALAVFLITFRLQMFHYGVSPLSWIYPSATPMRFGLDIVWLGFLLAHLRTGRMRFLYAAAIYSGAAVYYMISTGVYLAAAFYVYLAFLLLVPHLRRSYFPDLRRLAWGLVSGAVVVVSALFFFWLTLGHWVWSKLFWHNLIEYLSYFSDGRGALPIYESLKYRNFWASLMGFALPLLYVFTAIFVGILLALRKIRAEHLIVVVIAVYGLANYQYYVVRSAMTSYYINAVPFVLLCAFWLSLGLKRLDARWARRVLWGALALGAYALVTNHNYISYPNVFNFSPNPMVDSLVAQRFPDRQGYFNHQVKAMKEEDKLPLNSLGDTFEDIRTEESFTSDEELKAYFRQEFDFPEDARLIGRFTAPGEETAVLSSFETKFLIQAKRPPFFYHLPLITSQPMHMRAWPADASHSPKFLSDTIGQIETARPQYIFVEKVFLQDKIPPAYTENHPNITALVAYIRSRYTPVEEGKYLSALKRKAQDP